MSTLKAVLPPLQPPAGGYERLAQALAGRRPQVWQARLTWAGSIAALILAMSPLLRSPSAESEQAQVIAASLQRAWAVGDQDIVVENGAAAQMLEAPGLRVYWVDVVEKPSEAATKR